ncbi:hypothetical protein J6590_032408 [Homalodisca vitripennis]|nr:hypothetical protein J6590_032408 [Homalodisca vitripennis]
MAFNVEQKVKSCAWAIACDNITEAIRQFQVAYLVIRNAAEMSLLCAVWRKRACEIYLGAGSESQGQDARLATPPHSYAPTPTTTPRIDPDPATYCPTSSWLCPRG